MRRLVLCRVLGLAASCVTSCAAPGPAGVQRSLDVLRSQECAWNAGDVEAFFARGYWESPDLTFYSGGERHVGYDAVLQRYLDTYGRSAATMGELTFTEVDTHPLGRDHALVRGRWHLAFPDGTEKGGLFTLVMLHDGESWRIMHDHTSTAANEE